MSAKTQPGLLARKLGMLTRYDDSGRAYGATVLQCDLNVVTQLRTTDRDGYTAIQVGTRGDKKILPVRSVGISNRLAKMTRRSLDCLNFEWIR